MASEPTAVARDANLLARLDRIPVNRATIGLIALLSLVWLAEAFDIGIVGPVITVLHTTWNLSKSQLGLIGISSTLGVVLGMIPAGVLADRLGRRKVVLYGIFVFSLITVCGAFVHSLWPLLAVRFCAGIGEGAVLPMPYLLLSEFVRTRRRAISVGYANGILTAAYLIPNLTGAWAVHAFASDVAWRIPFLMGVIPLVLLIPLAIWLPESPRFLLKRGHIAKVTRLVEHLESLSGLPHDPAFQDPHVNASLAVEAQRRGGSARLLQRPYLGRGLVVMTQLTGALLLFYILLNYGAPILEDRGFQSTYALLYTAAMMGIAGIGSIAQGYLAERFGRKSILSTYYLLAAIGCAVLGAFVSPVMTVIGAFLAAFFGLGVFPVAKTVVAEQYPTQFRGRGVYYVEMSARLLSGVITLYFIPDLLALWGNQRLYVAMAIALLVLATPLLIWGRETARMSVEEAGIDEDVTLISSAVKTNSSYGKT